MPPTPGRKPPPRPRRRDTSRANMTTLPRVENFPADAVVKPANQRFQPLPACSVMHTVPRRVRTENPQNGETVSPMTGPTTPVVIHAWAPSRGALGPADRPCWSRAGRELATVELPRHHAAEDTATIEHQEPPVTI